MISCASWKNIYQTYAHYLISLDVFSQVAWKDLRELQDPELQELAAVLPNLALQSREPATVKKYSGAFSHWRKWAAAKSEIGTTLPPKPIHIALYLSFLAQCSKSSAPLTEAVCALSGG